MRRAARSSLSAAICCGERRVRLRGAGGRFKAGTLNLGKRAISFASTGTFRLPYRAPVPLLLSWPHM